MRKLSMLFLAIIVMSCQVKENKAKLLEITPPVSENSMQPFLFVNGGDLMMTWTEKENDSVFSLNFSKMTNDQWTEKTKIKKGQNWFVNWADFPSISGTNQNLISYYLEKSDAETYAYDIFLKQSADGGINWDIEHKLHSDTTKTEHGFVSFTPSASDSFYVTWLDGRNTKNTGHDHGHGENGGAMQIRVAEIMNTGSKKNEFVLDARTCDCCQTSTSLTEDGPIVVWRDRSDQEIRDIYFAKFKDGSWTKPRPVFQDNWKINGCPVNGPKSSVSGNSAAVAWFTAADNIPKVKLSFSKDNGESFLDPIVMSEGKAIGRVDLLMLDEANALISWMESSDEAALVKIAKVGTDNKIEKIITAGEISSSRTSGFPQMELVGDQIYLAWNGLKEDQSKVRVFKLSLEALN